MERTRVLAVSGILVGIFAATWASAHGPQVKVDPADVAAGQTVTVGGQGIASNGPIRLTLQGVLRDYDLGTTQGDEHGRFQMTVTVPPELAPGEYTVVASGTETATVRLTVTAAAQPAHPEAATVTEQARSGHPEEPEMAREGAGAREDHGGSAPAQEARDEPMDIPRSLSAGELATVWATILLSAAIGAALLRRGRSAQRGG